MHTNAGHALHPIHAGLTCSRTWVSADESVRPSPAAGPDLEDWSGLERLEQVVVRQRRYMVRDVAAAAAFAGLSIAVILALL